MKLPTWEDCQHKKLIICEELNELEKFIYDNEPASPKDKEWRKDLLKAINSFRQETK